MEEHQQVIHKLTEVFHRDLKAEEDTFEKVRKRNYSVSIITVCHREEFVVRLKMRYSKIWKRFI